MISKIFNFSSYSANAITTTAKTHGLAVLEKLKQIDSDTEIQTDEKEIFSDSNSDTETMTEETDITDIKVDRIDRFLDKFVSIGGSGWAFLVVNILLIGWIVGLVPTKASVTWQSVISDAQAIFCYIYDSLLMRQQLQENEQLLATSGILRSRMTSINRMLVIAKSMPENQLSASEKDEVYNNSVSTYNVSQHIPKETLYDRVATFCLNWIGSLTGIIIYWIGIFVWIGFGSYCNWSNNWQLYINSATSALMVFIFIFLANIRERNKIFVRNCFKSVANFDIELESKLRKITSDREPHVPIIIEAPKPDRIERLIDVYAQIVGRLVGILIIIVVLIVWIAIGPVMKFNDNWFLISGTYAGLIGLFDGFVLRNAYARTFKHEEIQFDEVKTLDERVLNDIGLPAPEEKLTKYGISGKIAIKISMIFATKITVIIGLLAIIGLVVASSALKWSVTGQLICNVPPSLVESFFMMVLICAHSIADRQRRDEIFNLCLRRQIMLTYVTKIAGEAEFKTSSEPVE